MKQVLILGDSISMGYREIVKQNLKGKADVCYYPENGRFSGYTLWLANQWIRNNGAPDIVHWNNGIWDISLEEPLEGNFTPIEEYADHLERIIKLLKRAGTEHIIFATTTYQHPDKKENRPEDVERYNQRAVEIMARENITVNDLGTLVKNHLTEYVCEDMVHLTGAGYQACAEQTTKYIMQCLV